MLDDHNLPLEEEPDGPAPGDPAPEPAPVIVLQRRGSGLLRVLVPPALILAASAAILSYRVQEPDWRGLRPGEPPAVVPVQPARSKPAEPPEPIIVRAEPAPAPRPPEDLPPPSPPKAVPPALALHPAAPPPAAPTDLIAQADPTPEQPDPRPEPRPEPIPPAGPAAARRAWDDIEREAERKQAEMAEMKALKRAAPAQARQDYLRRAVERISQARSLVETDRREFQAELRTLLKTLGSRSAPRIRSLCDHYGRSTEPEIRKVADRAMQDLSIYDRIGRVQVARRAGLPEPLIIDMLLKYEIFRMAARDGPRNADDALVRAARLALAVPVPPPMPQPVARRAPPPSPSPDLGR